MVGVTRTANKHCWRQSTPFQYCQSPTRNIAENYLNQTYCIEILNLKTYTFIQIHEHYEIITFPTIIHIYIDQNRSDTYHHVHDDDACQPNNLIGKVPLSL